MLTTLSHDQEQAATSLAGPVRRLYDYPELAIDGRTLIDEPVRWTDDTVMPQVAHFIADLGPSVVTSCFIPIRLADQALFIDQTYERVTEFHHINPVIVDDKYVLERMPERTVAGTVLLIGGSPENNWYHWILNWLPRLSLTFTLHPALLADPAVRFAFHCNVAAEPYRSAIDHLGIGEERLFFFDPQEGARFDRLLVPTFGNPNLYYPALLKRVHAVFRPSDTPLPTRRFYIGRETIAEPKRRIVNIDDVGSVLDSAAIEKLTLETMTGADQVKLFSSADLVVGVHGAGLANLIFSPPTTTVIILDNDRNIALGMAGMFSGLAKVLGMNHVVMRVDEQIIEGVDYDSFYNLHNRDVIVDTSLLSETIETAGKPVDGLFPGAAISRVQLDDYIAETNRLLTAVEPFVGMVPAGFEVDYLGIMHGLHLIEHWYPAEMFREAMVNERHRTTERLTPQAGEPFFEQGSMLRAVREGGETIRIVELGGGYGARSCDMAFHCQKVGKRSKAIIVEPIERYVNWGVQHLVVNGVDTDSHTFVQCAVDEASRPVFMQTDKGGFGNEVLPASSIAERQDMVSAADILAKRELTLADGSVFEMVNALSLTSLLAPFDDVDLIDVDVQHLEFAVLHPAWKTLNKKVRRLHIGTHSVDLHDALRRDLLDQGWTIEIDLLPFSETQCLDGPTRINDGILAAANGAFQHG